MSPRDENNSESILDPALASSSKLPPNACPPLSATQRCWFFSALVLGLVFLVVLPPFQGADEYKHWLRAWTVAEGHIQCGDIPQAAIDSRHHYRTLRSRRAQISLANTDLALQQEVGTAMTGDYTKIACPYPPFAYVVPAVALRTVVYFNGKIDKGDVIKAFYAGRVANWLTLCLAIYWFLLAVPACRNIGLCFLSIPEVLEQASQYNTDLTQFIFMLMLVVTVLRAPSRRRVGATIFLAVLLGMIKPVYCLFGLLALPGLVEMHATQGGKKRPYLLAAFLALLLPVIAWKLWAAANAQPAILPEGVNPGEQLSFVLHHPLRIFGIMWEQFLSLFGHNLMRGSISSILGGFGPARIELPMAACYALLVALALSVFSDLTFPSPSAPIMPASGTTRLARVSWIAAVGGVAVVLPAVVLAMYMFYTPVGAARAYGVQGRYYLVSLFILLVFSMRFSRARWPALEQRWSELTLRWPGSGMQLHLRTLAIIIAAIACAWADLVAINAVGSSYWFTG